jgi:signal peptidase I
VTKIDRPGDIKSEAEPQASTEGDLLAAAVRLGWHAGQLEVVSMRDDDHVRPVRDLLERSIRPLLIELGLADRIDVSATPTTAATVDALAAGDLRVLAAFGIGRVLGGLRMLTSSPSPPGALDALRRWIAPGRPEQLATMVDVLGPFIPAPARKGVVEQFRGWSALSAESTDEVLSSRIDRLRSDVGRWHDTFAHPDRPPRIGTAPIASAPADDSVDADAPSPVPIARVAEPAGRRMEEPPEGAVGSADGGAHEAPTSTVETPTEAAPEAIAALRREGDRPVDRPTRRRAARKRRRLRRGLVTGLWILVAVVAVLVLRVTAISTYVIPTGSMIPTIAPGDRVLVNILPIARQSPARGSLIVFHAPPTDTALPSGGLLLKRVIGLPGEVVSGSGASIYINGAKLSEPWLPSLRGACATSGYDFAAAVVPRNSYFVMGDCREDSLDSRSWGTISQSSIVGRPFLVVWRSGHPWLKWL